MGDGFTWDTENPEQDKKTAREAFDIAKEKLMSEKYQIVILDEINYVLEYKFFPLEEFLETLRNKPKDVHVVCTGRNAQEKLIELADLVTEMKLIKHPYDEQGIPAQKGIEF
jgi:cob(I)alamin adenosyltransferase